MTRLLIALALLLPAACKDDKKQAPPAEVVKPAAAPTTEKPPSVGGMAAAEPAGAEPQTMKQAMELICDAPNRSGVPAGASESDRAMATASWIKDNVTNPDALKLMSQLASVMPEDRGSILSDEAKKHNIGSCALAQMN